MVRKLHHGVPVIDGQHKLLLSYINKLARNVSQGSDPALLLEILDALAGYAFTHFNTEEIFFAASGYTEAGKHIRKHREFRQTVAEFREALDEGRAHIDINLLEFLKVWLIEHIQGMDTAMPHMCANAWMNMPDRPAMLSWRQPTACTKTGCAPPALQTIGAISKYHCPDQRIDQDILRAAPITILRPRVKESG